MHLEEMAIFFSIVGIALSLLIMMFEPFLGIALILCIIIVLFLIIRSIYKDK